MQKIGSKEIITSTILDTLINKFSFCLFIFKKLNFS